MAIEKFRVIKGGGERQYRPDYIFQKGFITNTRLMGVIGMKLYWKKISGDEYVQFFHLDWEEYGIDGFESLLNPEEEDLEILEGKIMGGLGGKLVEINEKEAIYLLKEAYKVNQKYRNLLPEDQSEYLFLIDKDVEMEDDELEVLWDKMVEVIETDIQLVNYFLMRAVGKDNEALKVLSQGEVEFEVTSKPSTLIKNVVELSHEEDGIRYYSSESVIDFENAYQLLISLIGITNTEKGLKVTSAEIKNKMKITPIEAAFQLKKPEYILIYEVDEFVDLLEILDRLKPRVMQNIHQSGFLLTEFNSHNEHVKEAQYYLNGDIYAVYYITTGNQLIVSTFKEENLREIKRFFRSKELKEVLEFSGEFKADTPLIYEFVQSGLEDFYEFLDGE